MTDVSVFVPASEVFPESSTSFEAFASLVRGLSRTDTLFWCARINLELCNPSKADPVRLQEQLILKFFDKDQIERLIDFSRGRKGGAREVAVFHRPQLLELMRWTALLSEDQDNDGVSFEDPNARRRFAEAALIAGDVWARWVFRDRVRDTGNVLEDRKRAITAFKLGVASNAPAIDMMNMLARGISLYRSSFTSHYPTADEEFRDAMGMSLDHYQACVAMMAINFTKVTKDGPDAGPGIIRVDRLAEGLPSEAGRCLVQFVQRESQTADDLRAALGADVVMDDFVPPFDYKPLREKPILRTPDGRAIILDPVFFSEKAAVGPLFAMAAALKTSGRAKRVNTVFGAFGRAFEDYVLSILRSIYPAPSPHLADRLLCNVKESTAQGEVEIADALLLDVNDAVLFEAKAGFIPDGTMHPDSPESYFAALRGKYGVTPGAPNDRAIKGVGQLARSIRMIANAAVPVISAELHSIRTLFPVLVVYDAALDSPGHADFFAEEFRAALEPTQLDRDGFMRLGRFRIAPLTLMTLPELERLESSVKHFRLVDMLREYASVAPNGPRPSLHDFWVANAKRFRCFASTELADRALRALDETAQIMFPGLQRDEAAH